MTDVRIQNVWKRYGAVEAVRDVSLTCPDGEMLALLGPSGCGKTSMLKMIAGIEDVTEGEILFGGRSVTNAPPGARNIAMVFEDYALYPHLSALENIAFPLKVQGYAKSEIKNRVDRVMGLLELERFGDDDVRKLSGGAQQRIGIGRALVRDPDLILFDEPLSHLDGDQKVQLRSEIKRLQTTAGLTSILVTHDQTEAIAMCDRVAIMNIGVLQQCASAQVVYERPANLFVANFVGEPPMNLLLAEVQDGKTGTALAGRGWTMPLTDPLAKLVGRSSVPEVVMGIRPQHLRIQPPVSADGTSAVIRGEVFFQEFRGDSEVVILRLERQASSTRHDDLLVDDLIIAECGLLEAVNEGDQVTVSFDAAHIHLFDGSTGENLLGENEDIGPAAANP